MKTRINTYTSRNAKVTTYLYNGFTVVVTRNYHSGTIAMLGRYTAQIKRGNEVVNFVSATFPTLLWNAVDVAIKDRLHNVLSGLYDTFKAINRSAEVWKLDKLYKTPYKDYSQHWGATVE